MEAIGAVIEGYSLAEVELKIKEIGKLYSEACKPFDFKDQGLRMTAVEYFEQKNSLKNLLSALKKRRREILKNKSDGTL